MSQCSWGAGHLPTAHSDGTDGPATRMLLGANYATQSLWAKLMLTHDGWTGESSANAIKTLFLQSFSSASW